MSHAPKKKPDPHTFWNAEYTTHEHFALSYNVSEELEHFARYLDRNHSGMPRGLHALDVCCGNGRNLAWLSRTHGTTGVGFDFSETAIDEARGRAHPLPLTFRIQDIHEPFPEKNNTYDLVIDFMASHVLIGPERKAYLKEVLRVLKPGGWFVVKTLLRDDDAHAERMIEASKHPIEGAYIHPRTGGTEYAGTESDLTNEYAAHFIIEKKQKSHAHRVKGKPNKRRFIVYYLIKEK